MRALREAAGLDHSTMMSLITVGLIEEDLRFGLVFETVQGAPGNIALLPACCNQWRADELEGTDVRVSVRSLLEQGLVRVVNPDAPRLEWALEVPAPLWDALRGECHEAPASWFRYRPPASLTALDEIDIACGTYRSVETNTGTARVRRGAGFGCAWRSTQWPRARC